MATPPEDDFPTKKLAAVLFGRMNGRDVTRACNECYLSAKPIHRDCAESDINPWTPTPPDLAPSEFNLLQANTPAYERSQDLLNRRAEARRARDADVARFARHRVTHVNDAYRYLDEPASLRAIDLARSFSTVGPRAQSLLVKIAERLAHGARQYGGDFDDKPRDWNKEALEEHMDAVVYMAMACMERDEAKAADKARAEAANRGPATAMPPVDMRHYNIDPRDGAAPAPTWPLTTPGEDWEKTRDGCG